MTPELERLQGADDIELTVVHIRRSDNDHVKVYQADMAY